MAFDTSIATQGPHVFLHVLLPLKKIGTAICDRTCIVYTLSSMNLYGIGVL